MSYTHLHGKATDNSEGKPARNRADIGRRFPRGYNNRKTCSHWIQIHVYVVDVKADKKKFINWNRMRFCKTCFYVPFLRQSSYFLVKFLNKVPFPIAFDFKVHVFFISYVSTSITKPRPCVVFHFDVIAQFGNISISKRPWNRKRMEHFIKLRKIYSIGFIFFRHTFSIFEIRNNLMLGTPMLTTSIVLYMYIV